jgi:hypothetical protein
MELIKLRLEVVFQNRGLRIVDAKDRLTRLKLNFYAVA